MALPKKVMGSLKRKVVLEEGEIEQPPRAGKTHKKNDPSPPVLAETTRPPRVLPGFAAGRGKDKVVVERRMSPGPQGSLRRSKRLARNYEGCKPAIFCTLPLHHSSAAVPTINNLPDEVGSWPVGSW